MILKTIRYFGVDCTVICDAKCGKAFGINGRPRRQISDDPDDYEILSDAEVPAAPEDPGTHEGGDAKPASPEERLNKWCVRECERSEVVKDGEDFSLPDFSKRKRNMPSLPEKNTKEG